MALGLLTGLAGSAISAGIGLGLDKLRQKQQLKQAKKLQDMQVEGNKELATFNQGLALDTWNKTNYEAQRKHIENAGLNVGLMYGMGGGGGATTSGGSGGSVGGQQAFVGNSAGMAIENALQLAMQEAQIKLINAQTKKTEADTTGSGLDNEFKKMQNQIKEATTYDEIIKISKEAAIATTEAWKGAQENAILSATQEAQITTIKNEAILKAVEIKQKEAEIKLTEAETKEVAAKIEKIVAEVSRMEVMTEQGLQEIILKKMQTEFNTSTPAQIKQWTDIGVDIVNATKGPKTIKTNWEKK